MQKVEIHMKNANTIKKAIQYLLLKCFSDM